MADPIKNDPTTTKSGKWAGAVAKATGTELATTDTSKGVDLMAMMGGGKAGDLVKKHEDKKEGQAVIDQLTNSGEWEFAPQLFKMEEGDEVSGILEGNGPPAEFERVDRTTGEVTTNIVQTWIIASVDGTRRISVLSTVQLDRKLPPYLGGPVKIFRGKDQNISDGRRVTDYLVAGPKLPNGARRTWATRPVIETTEAPQLPAGHEDLMPANPNGVAPSPAA